MYSIDDMFLKGISVTFLERTPLLIKSLFSVAMTPQLPEDQLFKTFSGDERVERASLGISIKPLSLISSAVKASSRSAVKLDMARLIVLFLAFSESSFHNPGLSTSLRIAAAAPSMSSGPFTWMPSTPLCMSHFCPPTPEVTTGTPLYMNSICVNPKASSRLKIMFM